MSLMSSFVVIPADGLDHWAYPTAQSGKRAFCLALCSAFLQGKSTCSEVFTDKMLSSSFLCRGKLFWGIRCLG